MVHSRRLLNLSVEADGVRHSAGYGLFPLDVSIVDIARCFPSVSMTGLRMPVILREPKDLACRVADTSIRLTRLNTYSSFAEASQSIRRGGRCPPFCRVWTVSTGRVRLSDCEMLPFGQHDRIMHTRHPEGTEGSRLPGGGHFHPAHPIEYLWFIRGGFSIYP
jgi:hypothetical protein